jgi:hypothetical protein
MRGVRNMKTLQLLKVGELILDGWKAVKPLNLDDSIIPQIMLIKKNMVLVINSFGHVVYSKCYER